MNENGGFLGSLGPGESYFPSSVARRSASKPHHADNRIERHPFVAHTAVAEQSDGRGQELGVRVGYRTESDGMLSAAWIGRRRGGRVAANEEGNVRISAQNDVTGRKRPKAIQAVFHHCVAIGEFHQPSRKGAEIVRARHIDDASYIAILQSDHVPKVWRHIPVGKSAGIAEALGELPSDHEAGRSPNVACCWFRGQAVRLIRPSFRTQPG